MSFFNNYIYGSNEYLGRLYLIVSSLVTVGLIIWVQRIRNKKLIEPK